jgi:hypothetical protein
LDCFVAEPVLGQREAPIGRSLQRAGGPIEMATVRKRLLPSGLICWPAFHPIHRRSQLLRIENGDQSRQRFGGVWLLSRLKIFRNDPARLSDRGYG